MELKGILDTSLGNFLCVRGFAKLGELYDVSDYDESFQRELIETHKQEVVNFLNDQKYLFFPEVILGGELVDDDDFDSSGVDQLYEKFGFGESFRLDFKNFTLQVNVAKSKSKEDARVFEYLRRAKIVIADKNLNNIKKPFTRIDGNHRISAVLAEAHFRTINTPFCIILFRQPRDKSEFSRVIFHNINSKSIPVGLDHSTRLILENERVYTDETLKTSPSFGIAYYFARKLYKKIDFDLLQNIHNSFKSFDNEQYEYASKFLKIFKFLIDKNEIGDSENTIIRFKKAISIINSLYAKNEDLINSKNDGLLAAFIYFELCRNSEALIPSFYDWVTSNHITKIDYLNPKDLTKVFDQIIQTKKRTIFVSMAFGKEKTDSHFQVIKRVCNEINENYKLKIKLKVERVDWFTDGTSYNISDKILSMIVDSGMLVGNLTYARPNVYHEIGFLMGRDRAMGHVTNNFLLILDESVANDVDKTVGFNLNSIKQIRFTESEKLAVELRDNIEKFYSLKQIE